MGWPEAFASAIGAIVAGEVFGGFVSDIIAACKKKDVCPCECHLLSSAEEEE